MRKAVSVHVPVLVARIAALVKEMEDGVFIDGTLGGGGHSEAVLKVASPGLRVVGIEKDATALELARDRLSGFGARFLAVHGSYADYHAIVQAVNGAPVRGFLMDLGMSSIQLAQRGRGFSFDDAESLDMRFNPEEGTMTAETIVNTHSERDLAEIFFRYGEERHSRRLARAIVRARREQPFKSARQLADFIAGVSRGKQGRKGKIHPATRVFQALRIAVNRELDVLESGLRVAERLLAHGGILMVITFHSLEDRIVKRFLKHRSGRCICPPGLPACACNPVNHFEVIERKPVVSTGSEVAENPRARSAKLRVARRMRDSCEVDE